MRKTAAGLGINRRRTGTSSSSTRLGFKSCTDRSSPESRRATREDDDRWGPLVSERGGRWASAGLLALRAREERRWARPRLGRAVLLLFFDKSFSVFKLLIQI